MDRSSVLFMTGDGTAKNALCAAFGLPASNCVDVRTPSEALALASRGIGRALVIGRPSANDEALTQQLRAVRPDFVVLHVSAPDAVPRASDLRGTGEGLVGSSPVMCRIREYVRKVAASECNVLVTGETGCGKEVIATTLHQQSRRRGRALTCINCATVPDTLFESELFGHERGAFTGALSARAGKFEQADGGTVFLDEVEELSPMAQAKLLRAIESRQIERLGGDGSRRIDVRIVAATNQDLSQLCACGKFRRDLYYRLAVVHVTVPPLRAHVEDIHALAAHFLAQLNRAFRLHLTGFEPDVIVLLEAHNWPGNVRELRNLLEAVAVEKQSGVVCRSDLPSWFTPGRHEAVGGPDGERYRMLQALESTAWNKARAARELNWSRMTLYRKMAQYEVESGPARKTPAAAKARADKAIA